MRIPRCLSYLLATCALVALPACDTTDPDPDEPPVIDRVAVSFSAQEGEGAEPAAVTLRRSGERFTADDSIAVTPGTYRVMVAFYDGDDYYGPGQLGESGRPGFRYAVSEALAGRLMPERLHYPIEPLPSAPEGEGIRSHVRRPSAARPSGEPFREEPPREKTSPLPAYAFLLHVSEGEPAEGRLTLQGGRYASDASDASDEETPRHVFFDADLPLRLVTGGAAP